MEQDDETGPSDVLVDQDSGLYDAPPGEEGQEISHEGGEHEGFHNIVWQLGQLGFSHRYQSLFLSYYLHAHLPHSSKPFDYRTRQDQTQC